MDDKDAVRHSSEQEKDEIPLQDRYRTFHLFPRLPNELRVKIWGHFAPALATEPFLLQFRLRTCDQEVFEGPSLKSQTAAARAVLGTHRQSRDLALRSLPDTLNIRHDRVVRFRRERDIVLLHEIMFCFDEGYHGCDPSLRIPGFSEQVVNLALNFGNLEGSFLRTYSVSCFPEVCNAFPNVKVMWSCSDYRSYDIFRFQEPLSHSGAGISEVPEHRVRPWCHEPLTWRLRLEAVDDAFVDIKYNIADAVVYLPDLENPLLHGEVNSFSYRSENRGLYDDGEKLPDAWRRFFAKQSAFEWFRERSANHGGAWHPLLTRENIERLMIIEMWPLVASYSNIRDRRL